MSEEKPPESEVAQSSGSARGLIIVALVIIGGIWLFSVIRNNAEREILDTLGPATCSPATYRSQAEPLMNELGGITDQVDIRDEASRSEGRNAITAVLVKINRLDCRDEFPLKHETLEFAARHFRDALTAIDAGDMDGAAESLDAAALNATRFNDWSADMD